jgi:Uncharacterized low-complexity proteins
MSFICKISISIISLCSSSLLGPASVASAFVTPTFDSSLSRPLLVSDAVKRSLTRFINCGFLPSLSKDKDEFLSILNSKKDRHSESCISKGIDLKTNAKSISELLKTSSLVLASLYASVFLALHPVSANAAEGGASNVVNTKITTGGASTLQSGRTIAITRGVNLDRSDFSNQNLKGVAFQQSIVRDANFKGSNLIGASFFDATLDGTNFEDADMTQVNLEMAQLSRANLKNAVVREMYVGGK